MTYRRKSSTSYAKMRSTVHPSVHMQFKTVWEQGLSQALERASKLESEGWTVDYNKGALMQSQAENVMKAVKDEADVQLIPVAKWMKEDVVLIAYKPKPQKEAPKQQPQPQPVSRVTTEKLLERFQKIANDGEPLNQESLAKGEVLDKSRVMAFVKATSNERLAQLAKEVVKQENLAGQIRVNQTAQRALIAARTKGYQYVQFGNATVDTRYIQPAFRILKGANVTIYGAPNKPLTIVAENGDMLMVAPALNASSPLTIKFEEALKLVPYVYGSLSSHP
ncbi:MAG: hypothetical protein ACPL4I_12235 [Bacteroidota bacterium]